MKLARLIEFLRNRLPAVKLVCYAILALLVLGDIALVNKDEAHAPIEHWPGFWAVFGFAGCVVIIVLSKAFGHAGIMTREDYYERPASDEPEA